MINSSKKNKKKEKETARHYYKFSISTPREWLIGKFSAKMIKIHHALLLIYDLQKDAANHALK